MNRRNAHRKLDKLEFYFINIIMQFEFKFADNKNYIMQLKFKFSDDKH